MVGIVIVSHSHRLAEGAAELARQMAGDDVHIETAGGLDEPGHPIGTDAMLVMAAIERAWSDDGVVVLMDLGSAVLSTEMALEFLDEDRRAQVLLTDAPLVEGAVAAAVTASMGAPRSQVAAEAVGGLAGKRAHLGIDADPGSSTPAPTDPGAVSSLELVVDLPHGLHARPAARLVRVASAFDADVRVRNVTTGAGPVDARSLNAVATLGVTTGHTIDLSASGVQAGEALDALRALAARRFDESAEDLAPDAGQGSASPAPVTQGGGEQAPEGMLRGVAASPGSAVGRARRFRVPEPVVPDGPPEGDVGDETARLQAAIDATRADIEHQLAGARGRLGQARASIFDAHLLFLQDPALLEPARAAIAEGAAAPAAWRDAVYEVAGAWDALDDPYLRERAADLRSVGRQLLAQLLGLPAPRPELDAPGILVAADLAPADTAGLDPSRCLGIATAHGGPTSHAAVLARGLGIPAVVGLGDGLEAIAEGAPLGLDGSAGTLWLDPAPDLIAMLEAERAERAERVAAAHGAAREPAVTLDGTAVEVAANVGGPADIAAAVDAGCDGVGLFRTEFLFLDRATAPTEDEQEAAYREAAEALGGRPLIVRTLDAGADKPLPYLDQHAEDNPFLGVRGIRLGLAQPDVLDTQLRALLRVAADHPLQIMFPMVATLDELRAGRAALDRARDEVKVDAHPRIGIMIEVPAAALVAERLAAEVDFFSIGTNDLTQYTLAADRGNDRVAHLSDPLHPAVLRLIGMTCAAAATTGAWVGVCGEVAGDPAAAPVLLGLGVRELSMGAPSIPLVKVAVRATDLAAARDLATHCLELPDAAAVRSLLAER